LLKLGLETTMPWEVNDAVKQRWEFVKEWESEDWGFAELCREYGITRATGYKWVERYQMGGLGGLGDASRAPHRHPNQTSPATEKEIVEVRAKHPRWGARKIQAILQRQWADRAECQIPATSTIGAMLKQYGLTVGRSQRQRAEPSAQPLAEGSAANALWCVDCKGWFRTGDGKRCDPLTITDGYSRYLLRCQGVEAADTVHTQVVMEGAFLEYGLPERIRSDNGAPFGSNGRGGLTRLAVWWMRLGIQPERIQPGRPQQNGRHERMHLTLQQETAEPPAVSLRGQQQRFNTFLKEYNNERPHEALKMSTPSEYYQRSAREYPKRLPEATYPVGWEVRQVGKSGQFKLWTTEVFVSHALAGQQIGLHPLTEKRSSIGRFIS